jgi:hypothetical protein
MCRPFGRRSSSCSLSWLRDRRWGLRWRLGVLVSACLGWEGRLTVRPSVNGMSGSVGNVCGCVFPVKVYCVLTACSSVVFSQPTRIPTTYVSTNIAYVVLPPPQLKHPTPAWPLRSTQLCCQFQSVSPALHPSCWNVVSSEAYHRCIPTITLAQLLRETG